MLENIKNNTIVICNSNYKMQLLKSIKKLINIKFMSMDEFIKSYYFDYDEKTILHLIKKYNMKYEVALEYLTNLIYVEDKNYNNDKLDFLVNLKKELIDNNLLIINNKFKSYISDKDIIIYNYSLSKFEKHLLKDINYNVIEKESNNYKPIIYEFTTMEEEIEYVARKISELINNGVDINNIKLTNVSNDYINLLTKIFNFYNLKINKFNNIPIISTVIGKTFYENLSSLEKGIESIEKYNTTDTYNKIVSMCNKYVWCSDINDLKILLEYDLKHTFIENNKYTNMIEVVDYKNYDFNDEYVFMLGFNQGIIPKIFKDEDYISDNIKPDYLDTVVEKNKQEKEEVIKSIKNIKNLTITYKLKNSFSTFYPSNLIDELDSNVERVELDYKVSYSEISDKITLTNMLDELIKFGKIDNNLDLLNSNYDIPYNTYSHSFTGLSKTKLKNYINNLRSFNLSYSSMDNYNRCAFRFYIDKILCLKDNIDMFSVTLGNIYHDVLEKAVKSDIDVREEVYKYISDNDIKLTNSNKFFVERTIKNIEYLIEVLKKQEKFSNLKNIETEKFVKIPIKDNINFVGFIDKIVYNTINDITIAAIIDYKTYVKKPSLKYIDSGIGLQLPTYMYLSENSFKNIRFAGFYLQNITLDNKSDDEKEKSLKLIGFTNTDKKILKEFDSNYMDSSVIDGIKIKNDGSFSSNSLKHMLNGNEINEIINVTKDKINETINNVLESKFDINPKYDKVNLGCEFCKYKDLCFMKEYDFVNIKANSKFGGEEDE
ncbi:MAG: PD-(D/E)XK nuclease family protein [Bacilli bacterium]|nr:PD-(D/E)XK nuclease family protein [Bacilli bacterium]